MKPLNIYMSGFTSGDVEAAVLLSTRKGAASWRQTTYLEWLAFAHRVSDVLAIFFGYLIEGPTARSRED